MMFNGGKFKYYKDEKLGVEIIGLPYKGQEVRQLDPLRIYLFSRYFSQFQFSGHDVRHDTPRTRRTRFEQIQTESNSKSHRQPYQQHDNTNLHRWLAKNETVELYESERSFQDS